MKFIKKNELELANGGYLVFKEGQLPVNHEEFVTLQEEAHYLVSLANKVSMTDFTSKQPISFQSVVDNVTKSLNDEKRIFVESPKAVATPTSDKLQKEALTWLNNKADESKTEKLNRILQKFSILQDFENFGLYFSTDKIVKLKQLYSLEEIVNAVSILEPHLTE